MAAIIILGLPRSGSSMVSGIFEAHGVWTGTCRGPDRCNEKGYFENIRFKAYMKKYPPNVEAIDRIMHKDGYTGGPWLWKVLSKENGEFDIFKPKYICCKRPAKDIFMSMRASGIYGGQMSNKKLKKFIRQRQARLRGIEIDTSYLARGWFDQIALAIESCGLKYNQAITKDFVDEKLWHYHS